MICNLWGNTVIRIVIKTYLTLETFKYNFIREAYLVMFNNI